MMSARWHRYGPGTLIFHLTSGQSISVEVEDFAWRRENNFTTWEFTPAEPDTLALPPSVAETAAIEHHPKTLKSGASPADTPSPGERLETRARHVR